MKQRFGGVLALVLGTVLIVNGLSGSGDGAIGTPPPNPACGSQVLGVIPLPPSTACPTGGITITDTTPPAAGVPADWDVTITSVNCLDTDGQPVNQTVTVPTGGQVSSSPLFIFTNSESLPTGLKCEYTLTREVNAAYTATFTPSSPVTIPFSATDRLQSDRVRQVTLLNEAVTVSTSTVPTTSAAASSSASASASADPTDEEGSSSAAPASDSNAAAPIAETGPSQPVKASLWLGIGLLLLGLFLCFEGRVRTFARHRR